MIDVYESLIVRTKSLIVTIKISKDIGELLTSLQKRERKRESENRLSLDIRRYTSNIILILKLCVYVRSVTLVCLTFGLRP